MSAPPPVFMGDMDQFRRDQERYRAEQERFKNQPPLDLLGSFPRTDQRYDPGREYQTVIDPQPLDMGGIGMLQQGRMGPLSGLGQYISQELEQQNQGEVDEFIGEVGDMANQRFGVDLGSVGQRPMFMAGGGAAFPDLSGDGKITQKDILMGRGVIPKPMQMGGSPMMTPPMPIPPPEAPPMEAAAPQEQLDPNVVQQALSQAAGGIASLDEAQNYEDVMNSMRGDQASVEQRRQELAGVVGPGDASQTPESVLTLVQPVMMLANVDQGVGGLAQEEMTQPMEGPMAEGIMSTVPEPPMMEADGTVPVNFKYGGEVRPVQYFNPLISNRVVGLNLDPGTGTTLLNQRLGVDLAGNRNKEGDIIINEFVKKALSAEKQNPGTGKNRLNQLFEGQLDLYRKVGLGDVAERQAMAEQQKRLTKAQMLFDIATTALAFAAPMEGERPGLSPAERLAMAARSTQLPEKIGARAQAQLQLDKEAKKEERAIELAALQSAETKLAAEKAEAAAIRLARAKETVKDTDVKGVPRDVFDKLSKDEQKKLLGVVPTTDPLVKGVPKSVFDTLDKKSQDVILGLVGDVKGVPRDVFNTLDKDSQKKILGLIPIAENVKGVPKSIFDSLNQESKNSILGLDKSVKGIPMSVFDTFSKEEQKKILGALPLESKVKGIPKMIFESLTDEQKERVLGVEADNVKGIPRDIFDRLPQTVQTQILGGTITLAPEHKVFDLTTNQVVAEGADKLYKLKPGEVVKDKNNEVVLTGPAKEELMGSKSETAEITYITNEARLKAYADGSLGAQEVTQFEQKVLSFVSSPSLEFIGGRYVPGDAPKLANDILLAIAKRKENGYPSLNIPGQTDISPKRDSVEVLTPPQEIPEFGTKAFNLSLFDPVDGNVNLNSPSWAKVPLNIIKPNLNYPETTGIMSFQQRLANYFGETFRELGGKGLSEEGQKFSRAESDIITLRNEILSTITQGIDDSDRILKFVQEQLAEETNKLTPGMWTTDETALSKLKAVEGKLAYNIQTLAKRIPEYGGDPGTKYNAAQITKARTYVDKLVLLTAEVGAIRKIYENALSTGALKVTPESVGKAKDWMRGQR